jgi:tRNA dimethylallyltransferase
MVAKKIVPLLVVVGETASGKSALALHLAQLLDGEIICADAWTVRQGADIGTAKPSKKEQELVPHHLLDIIKADEPFSAADFKSLAIKKIDKIGSRGKLPILVGGTGLYIDGVIYDYSFLPSANDILRDELNSLELPELLKMAEEKGLDISSIDSNNKRRVIRLIETNGARGSKKSLRNNTLIVGIKPDADQLKDRITDRTDSMLGLGLEKEVFELSRQFGWGCEALKGIGFKEWKDYYEGNISKGEVRERIIKNTLDFAKRQRTWFKRNKSIHWFSTPVNLSEVVELVTTQLLS